MMNRNRAAFSLVELVVVIVIIGIIAAMAIPRLSRGSAGAADSSVSGSLATIRRALQLYQAEHNGNFPTQADFVDQLTKYTNASGDVSATKAPSTHPFGPYLVAIPPCPVGDQSDPTAIAFDTTNSPPSVTADTGGWIYNPNTGEFLANSNATDVSGKAYNTY